MYNGPGKALVNCTPRQSDDIKYASASEEAADYKAYASKNCEDIIEEQESSGQSVSEWDPYSASGSVATDAQ